MGETVHGGAGALLQIGDVAERIGLSLRTIRHYDEIDLVRPAGRTAGGFRLYTERDVARLLLIKRMKPLGYSLEEMAGLLVIVDALEEASGDEARAEAQRRLAGYIDDAQTRRARVAEQLSMADEFLGRLAALPGAQSEG